MDEIDCSEGGSASGAPRQCERGRERTYAIGARATDVAGNVAGAEAECVVPHSRGG